MPCARCRQGRPRPTRGGGTGRKSARETRRRTFFRKKHGEKFGRLENTRYLCTRLQQARALSSAGLEHLPYKQRVGGSNPSAPTDGETRSGLPFFLCAKASRAYIACACLRRRGSASLQGRQDALSNLKRNAPQGHTRRTALQNGLFRGLKRHVSASKTTRFGRRNGTFRKALETKQLGKQARMGLFLR